MAPTNQRKRKVTTTKDNININNNKNKTNHNNYNKTNIKRNNDLNKNSTQIKQKRSFLQPIPERPSTKGEIYVCGFGNDGQLGLGYSVSKCKRPELIASITDAVDVCAGGIHTLILTNEGNVYSFGCNDEGALGRESNEENSFEPGLVNLPGKAVKISAGDSHSACLLETGTVMAWGSFRNLNGNMGFTLDGCNKPLPYKILPNKICCSIASGSNHLVMLSCDGFVYTIGCADQGQLGRVSQRSAFGDERFGKKHLLQPLKVTNGHLGLIDTIWATNYCTFVQEARTCRVFAFGLNNYKQLVVKKNLNLVFYPVLTNFIDVKRIAGGEHHTMVLKHDGTVHVIGRHHYGRLGLGEINEDITTLKPIEALNTKFIVDISCGDVTSFAITKEGELYSWGIGSNSQLGTGSRDDALEPVNIKIKSTAEELILRVDSGGVHSIFLSTTRK